MHLNHQCFYKLLYKIIYKAIQNKCCSIIFGNSHLSFVYFMLDNNHHLYLKRGKKGNTLNIITYLSFRQKLFSVGKFGVAISKKCHSELIEIFVRRLTKNI